MPNNAMKKLKPSPKAKAVVAKKKPSPKAKAVTKKPSPKAKNRPPVKKTGGKKKARSGKAASSKAASSNVPPPESESEESFEDDYDDEGEDEEMFEGEESEDEYEDPPAYHAASSGAASSSAAASSAVAGRKPPAPAAPAKKLGLSLRTGPSWKHAKCAVCKLKMADSVCVEIVDRSGLAAAEEKVEQGRKTQSEKNLKERKAELERKRQLKARDPAAYERKYKAFHYLGCACCEAMGISLPEDDYGEEYECEPIDEDYDR